MLLEREDVTPKTKGDGDRTPLSWAAINGREGIVQVLLEGGVSLPALRIMRAEHLSRGQLEFGVGTS